MIWKYIYIYIYIFEIEIFIFNWIILVNLILFINLIFLYIKIIIIKLIMKSSRFDSSSSSVRPQKLWTSPFYSSMNSPSLKTLLPVWLLDWVNRWKFSDLQLLSNFVFDNYVGVVFWTLVLLLKENRLCHLATKLLASSS